MNDLKAVKAAERTAEREARAAERAARRSSAKADREGRSRKGAPPRELSVAITSFDFLDGSYRTSRNARLVNYVVLGVIAAVLMVVIGTGLNNVLSANSERSTLEDLQAQQQAQRQQLAGAGGVYSQTQITEQLEVRAKQAGVALGKEVDALRVLNDLRRASSTGGVTIERIALPGGADPKAPSSGEEKEGAEEASEGRITISAIAADYSQADSWDQAVQGITYLQDVTTDVTGGEGSSITVTTTAKLGGEVTGIRAEEVRSQLGVKPSTDDGGTP